jgi:hypothetical protein
MVILSLYPCCAFEDCEEGNPISMQQPADHEDEEEDCGINCEGCCGTISMKVESNNFSLLSLNSLKVYTNFLQPFIPEVHFDFWRPPQLG